MKLRKLRVEGNTTVAVAVFAAIILLDAGFATTHWAVWIHWKWTAILGHFVGITLGVFFVWGLSFETAEQFLRDKNGNHVERSRLAAYALCGIVVLSFS